MIASLGVAFVLIAQDPPVQPPPPPPIVHFVPPKDATIDVRADCWGQPVRFVIEAREGQVRILSYSGAGGEATQAQLEQWNGWLAPMRRINGHEFQCRGPNEALNIWGVRGEIDGAVSVPVRWENGYLRLLPDPNTLASGSALAGTDP